MDKYVGYTGYGDGDVCETCGFNQDTLDVSLDVEIGRFDVSLMAGCYNWLSENELTKEQALEWLKEHCYEDGYMADTFREAIEFVEDH